MSLELILILYFASIIIACIYAQVRIPNKEKFWLVSMVLFILVLLLMVFDILGQMSFFESELHEYSGNPYDPRDRILGWYMSFFPIPLIIASEISTCYILIKDYIKSSYSFLAIFTTSLFYAMIVYLVNLIYMIATYH